MIVDLGLVKREHDRKKMMAFYWLDEKLGDFGQMKRDS